jgi:hypothetical protein
VCASARAVAAPTSPGLAARQLVVDGDPPLPRMAIEGDPLGDRGEAGRKPELLTDSGELLASEAAAERQRL